MSGKRGVLIALGGAWNVWEDFEAAKSLIDRYEVGAAKWSGAHYEGHLTLWCSLHPEMLPAMQRARARAGRNSDYLSIAHKGGTGRIFGGGRLDRVIPQVYSGCSGLYLAWAAVQLGWERVICCGMPLSHEPHFNMEKPWADAHKYRSEEHTSELQSLMRISYAVFCLKKKNQPDINISSDNTYHKLQ